MTTPYTYLIISKTTKMAYYGSRTANKCNPKDLWSTYFTSSKIIKQLIKTYGKDDFICCIRKIFKNKNDALKWEKKVLQRLAVKSEKFLNQRVNSCKPWGKTKCINNGIIEMRIAEKIKIPEGWIRGRLCKTSKGKTICYNPLTKKEIRCYENDIPAGFIKGKLKRIDYYNPQTKKTISLLENEIIPEGFIRGRGYSNIKNKIAAYDENKNVKYFSDSNDIPNNWTKGIPKGGRKNTITYYNPETYEEIILNEFELIPIGFIKGSLKQKGRISPTKNKIPIYNNQLNKTKWINKDDSIPLGWVYGTSPNVKNADYVKGSYWVYNEITLKTKMVKWKYIENGWKKGRRPKTSP